MSILAVILVVFGLFGLEKLSPDDTRGARKQQAEQRAPGCEGTMGRIPEAT